MSSRGKMDKCSVLVLVIPFLASCTSEIGVGQQLLSLQGRMGTRLALLVLHPSPNEHVGPSLNKSVFSLLRDQPLPTLTLRVWNRNVTLASLVVFQKPTFSHGLTFGRGGKSARKLSRFSRVAVMLVYPNFTLYFFTSFFLKILIGHSYKPVFYIFA